ncbi:MAG: S-layer homology domain-containing protein [Oscillospiraceae bacterium]|nr:S-layer homology domain-containing protein [Oscillospiraceae bacterium]
MKSKTKRLLSILLTATMVVALFAAIPIVAKAADAAAIAEQINNFAHGGNGTLKAEVSGSDVIVTGKVTDVKNTLELSLDYHMTVIWRASYYGMDLGNSRSLTQNLRVVEYDLIRLRGGGAFEVGKGGLIAHKGGGNAIYCAGKEMAVVVDGGEVSAVGNYNAATDTGDYSAIKIDAEYNRVIVKAGKVTGVEGGHAINAKRANISIEVHGGEVSAADHAIYAYGDRFNCEVSGGVIKSGKFHAILIYNGAADAIVKVNGGEISSEDAHAIFSDATNTKIEMKGGAVKSENGHTIYSNGANAYIQVSGGATVTSKKGNAIYFAGENSHIEVHNGTVKSEKGSAICGGTKIEIHSGALVQNFELGYPAIDAYKDNVAIFVNGGTVSADRGHAVRMDGAGGSIEIAGGTMESLGDENNWCRSTISLYNDNSNVTVSGGTVKNMGGHNAIEVWKENSAIKVTGGFVFSYGNAILADIPDNYTAPYAVISANCLCEIGRNAVVCAWNKARGVTVYTAGTAEDLKSDPANAKAVWRKVGSQNGIDYKNGSNTGFFPLNVTVNEGTDPVELFLAAPSDLGLRRWDFHKNESTVTLKWTDNSDNESHFIIERAMKYIEMSNPMFGPPDENSYLWTVIGTVDANVTTFEDTYVTPINADEGEVYWWRVQAVRVEDGQTIKSAYTNVVEMVISSPSAPSDLTATAEADGIKLNWKNNSGHVGAFKIIRSETSIREATEIPPLLVEVPADETSYMDETAEPGVRYYYVVRARSTFASVFGSESPYSNEVSAMIPADKSITVSTQSAPEEAFPFTDIEETSGWIYESVKAAWEMGLINGKTDTQFMPDDNLTYAEAVKLAACMHQLHTTGEVTLAVGAGEWYDAYVAYAKQNGIIGNDYAWNSPATRAGYMEIFANALPSDALAPINTISDGSIPDVPAGHIQAWAIYRLYRAGIVQGVDGAHSCNPGANIKRSEVAAILIRMMDSSKRIKFDM